MSDTLKHFSDRQPSGHAVNDFSPYCEGDIDPTLNKRINTLIDSDTLYMVYLDDDLSVQWTMTDTFQVPTGFGEIANRVGHLENMSQMFLGTDQLAAFRRMLGEAIARIVGDDDLKQARACLKIAEAFLQARGSERARGWYLTTATAASVLSAICATALWISRAWIISVVGVNAFELLIGTLMGGIGSLLPILIGLKTTKTDVSAGAWPHRLEGAMRVGAGMGGAMLIALAIKADVLFSLTKAFANPATALYFLCFAAGWSERFANSLINKVEYLVSGAAPAERNGQDES